MPGSNQPNIAFIFNVAISSVFTVTTTAVSGGQTFPQKATWMFTLCQTQRYQIN